MAKLNQIVAVVNGKKTEAQKELTGLHRRSGKPDLFSGLQRIYQPLDEEGEQLPPENSPIQDDVSALLSECRTVVGDLLDIVATQDFANCEAKADVVVDGQTIIEGVPVSHLLFLEKQLQDLHTFFAALPVLSNTEKWEKNEQTGQYEGEPYFTNKTKKVLQSKVLYEATREHPAQIEKWTEDAVVGRWNNKKFSTAIPLVERKKLVERVNKLHDAVKYARETANNMEVKQVKIGDRVFDYLLK